VRQDGKLDAISAFGSIMRLFQNGGLYRSYMPHLQALAGRGANFEQRRQAFLNDRYQAVHFLQPVLERDPNAFFTNGDDEVLQALWAESQGMPQRSSLDDILLAQIESHQTEVLYNLHPSLYGAKFIRRLPSHVKVSVCWLASPAPNADLSGYHCVLNNFPSLLQGWRERGIPAEYFSPAIDPVMNEYGRRERPIDVLFVGGYSRHHMNRARVLEKVAELSGSGKVMYCLDTSRLTQLAESPLGMFPPLRKYRRPPALSRVAAPPSFGRELYDLIGRAKIVLNGAIDMVGSERGNMRCFEAMGCGALLLSDGGNYPDGMRDGQTIVTYESPEDAAGKARWHLSDWERSSTLAVAGRRCVEELYSKAKQWQRFQEIVAAIQ
jgi:hypothetical protein